jgi:hypothetical protein
VQLDHELANVFFDGVDADRHALSDFLICESKDQSVQDTPLAYRELTIRLSVRSVDGRLRGNSFEEDEESPGLGAAMFKNAVAPNQNGTIGCPRDEVYVHFVPIRSTRILISIMLKFIADVLDGEREHGIGP